MTRKKIIKKNNDSENLFHNQTIGNYLKQCYTQNNKDINDLHKKKVDILYQRSLLEQKVYSFFGNIDQTEYGESLYNWPLLFNDYQLVNVVGKGGLCEVYKAFDYTSFDYVAIKVFKIEHSWNKSKRLFYKNRYENEC